MSCYKNRYEGERHIPHNHSVKTNPSIWLFLFLFAGCSQPSPTVKQPLPSVSEATAVLKDFRGEYSYGGVGMIPQSNDGELALWVIFHSPDAAKELVALYPQCQRTGKAYVLAGLYRADQTAFQKLTNAFSQEHGDIITGSGCIMSSESRAELVADMQRPNCTMAFYPSRAPIRRQPMRFLGRHRDVYAEQQAWEDSEKAKKERAIASLEAAPALRAFTNLFRVEDPDEGQGFTDLYSTGTSEWHAHLIPLESLRFPSRIEAAFPKSKGVVQVSFQPSQLIEELRRLNDLPFLKKLDVELNITCVRIRAAGDQWHWNTKEATQLEERLHSGVPLKDWVHLIVDAGTKTHKMISFYHPKGTSLYIVNSWLFESPGWRNQYAKITGKQPKRLNSDMWDEPDGKYIPVVDSDGKLTLVDPNKKQL